MTDVARLKQELEYLIELRRGFVDWKFLFPILTGDEDAILIRSKRDPIVTGTETTEGVNDKKVLTSVVTKHLNVIHESLSQRDLIYVTRNFRGILRANAKNSVSCRVLSILQLALV